MEDVLVCLWKEVKDGSEVQGKAAVENHLFQPSTHENAEEHFVEIASFVVM